MPLKSYAVLKGRPTATLVSSEGHPHFQLQLEANGSFYRVAINVRSMMDPSEMEYLIKLRFGHPITAELRRLACGLHSLESAPGGLALDYIRLNLFPRDQFLKLPSHDPRGGTDLNNVLDGIFASAIAEAGSRVYVFGEPWESDSTDRLFHFYPSRGMHDVHMNQGNDPCHWEQDGPWQDGAVLLEHPRQHRWTGIFLKFQSQSWLTNDVTGHPLPIRDHAGKIRETHPKQQPVRIVAVLVNPAAGQPRRSSATLLNVSPNPVDLDGWRLTSGDEGCWELKGCLEPGAIREVQLGSVPSHENNGGIVTLLNHEGRKVHGVYYTAEQALREGWRVAF
jgi:uncharacterized protein YukJ